MTIDKSELICNARDILDNYEIQYELSKRKVSIGSPASDGMPKGSKKGNPQEDSLVKQVTAEEYCDEVTDKIEQLKPLYRKIIKYKYLDRTMTDEGIAMELGISPRTLTRKTRLALLEFGLSCDLVPLKLA